MAKSIRRKSIHRKKRIRCKSRRNNKRIIGGNQKVTLPIYLSSREYRSIRYIKDPEYKGDRRDPRHNQEWIAKNTVNISFSYIPEGKHGYWHIDNDTIYRIEQEADGRIYGKILLDKLNSLGKVNGTCIKSKDKSSIVNLAIIYPYPLPEPPSKQEFDPLAMTRKVQAEMKSLEEPTPISRPPPSLLPSSLSSSPLASSSSSLIPICGKCLKPCKSQQLHPPCCKSITYCSRKCMTDDSDLHTRYHTDENTKKMKKAYDDAFY
jgi:hypothetical protein